MSSRTLLKLGKSKCGQGSGDQKFIPAVDPEIVQTLASKSNRLASLYKDVSWPMFAIPPYGLGYPSDVTQSSYYPSGNLSEAEISSISKLLELKGIYPENTRISQEADLKYTVHVASVQPGEPRSFPLDSGKTIQIVGGDHAANLASVCSELSQAATYAANDTQKGFLSDYVNSYQTGNLDQYRDSLRLWVKDKAPRVENIFGFVEPYRDPYGVRAEFEGLVAIVDDEETRLLRKLVDNSSKFIRRLPWAVGEENDGKGPFEKHLFEPPDFSSIHSRFSFSSDIRRGMLTTSSACLLLEHHLPRDQPAQRQCRLLLLAKLTDRLSSTTTSAKKRASRTSSSPTACASNPRPCNTPSFTLPKPTYSRSTSSTRTTGGSSCTSCSATAPAR